MAAIFDPHRMQKIGIRYLATEETLRKMALTDGYMETTIKISPESVKDRMFTIPEAQAEILVVLGIYRTFQRMFIEEMDALICAMIGISF